MKMVTFQRKGHKTSTSKGKRNCEQQKGTKKNAVPEMRRLHKCITKKQKSVEARTRVKLGVYRASRASG